MEIYYVSCKENTGNKNSSVRKTKRYRLMALSNCAVCDKKNLTFIKNQKLDNISNDKFKMNKTINTFLLTGYKCMPELHLKQPIVNYSSCGLFTKHSKRF